MAAYCGSDDASLDPAKRDILGNKPDLHRIERFVFAVTYDVDWLTWAGAQGRGLFSADGRALNDLEQIAEGDDRDAQDLLNQYQRELATP